MEKDKIVTWKDATEGMNDSEKLALFEQAAAMGIRAEDPIWILVLGVRQAEQAKAWSGQAAQAAGEAADRIRDEIRGLPEKLQEGAASGAEAIRKNILEGGEDLEKSIREAVVLGGRGILSGFQKAQAQFVPGLEAAAEIKKKEIVQDWQAALAGAVKNHGRSEFTKSVIFTVIALILMIGASNYVSFQYGENVEAAAEKVCNGNGWVIKKDEAGVPGCFKRLGGTK